MGIDVGQVIDGKYRVTARIGEGGMGAVYAGEHLKLHRRVAIKVLHAAMAQEPETVRRFEREAQAAGRIGNDHILEVFDIGEAPGGDRYIVMEFLDGEALDKRLARLGRVAPRDIYPLVRQLLQALAAAHSVGIVHRDLKPSNVFVLREKAGVPDYVKLIDFGISKFQSAPGDASKTRTGTVIGTPSYMSPEQARGLREADARSDIYAVGIILYEAVTGRVPFEGASTNDVLFKIFTHEPPPIAALAPDVDRAFGTVIMKALAKEPAARFQTAMELIAALDAWMQTGVGVALVAPVLSTRPNDTVDASPVAGGARTPAPLTERAWAESRPDAAKHRRAGRVLAKRIAVALLVLAMGASALWATLARRARSLHEEATPASAAPMATAPASQASAPTALPAAPSSGRETPAPVERVDAPPVTSGAAPRPAPPPARRKGAAPALASSGASPATPRPGPAKPGAPAPKGSEADPDFGY